MTDAQNTAREALIPRLTKLLAEYAWDESASQTIHEAITLFSALSAPQAPTAAPGASWTVEAVRGAVERVTAYLDEETKYSGGVSPRHWPSGPHLSYGDLRDILAALAALSRLGAGAPPKSAQPKVDVRELVSGLPEAGAPSRERHGFYVASRASLPARGEMWRAHRAAGVPINSTWIDEDGPKASRDLGALWVRIVDEVRRSAALILYVEPDDFPLKGALVEIGAALTAGAPVVIVAPGVELEPRNCRPLGSWIKHPLVSFAETVEEAFTLYPTPPALKASDLEREKLVGYLQELTDAPEHISRPVNVGFLQRILALLSSRPAAPECRRCSGCEGLEHHWMYCGDEDEAGEPVMSCKHCDVTRPIEDADDDL